MKLISIRVLEKFLVNNPDSEQHLRAWLEETKQADWKQPSDIKNQHRSVRLLKNRRVVFNIKGNDFKMVASVAYRFSAVYIKFIGTHNDYDLINAGLIELE